VIDLRQVQHAGNEFGEQEIVVELLQQLPFRAHRVERLQQQRPQLLLGGIDGWSSRAYSLSKSRDKPASAASVSLRVARSG